MKDDAVERVLAGLGKVEAPAGLERRVLRRLAESGSSRASGLGWGLRLVGGLALAGGLAWCVGILGSDGGRHTPGAKAPFIGESERPKAEALGYLQATAKAGDEVVQGRRGHTPDAKAGIVGGAERPKAEALGYLQAKAETKATRSGERSRIGALGYLQATVKAAPYKEKPGAGASGYVAATAKPAMESFPAPPEPLTEEERLLRQIALTGSKPAFELLNEETREAALAASDAEFEIFVRSAHSAGQSGGRKLEDLDFER